jgi:ATP-binding cassette, subfamily B, bacterial PglK
MKNYIKDILKLLGKDRNKIHKLFYFFIGASLVDLIGIGIIAPYISIISGDGYWNSLLESYNINLSNNELIITSSLILLFIFCLRSVVALLINWSIVDFGMNQQLTLRSLLMKSYLSIPYEKHVNKNSASSIFHIHQLTNQYSMQVLIPILRSLGEGLVMVFILIFLAWKSFIALSLLVLLLIIAMFTYDKIFRSKVSLFGNKVNQAEVEMIKSIQESADGLKQIRILGNEKYFYNSFKSAAYDYAFCLKKAHFVAIIPRYIFEVLIVIFVVFITLIFVLTNQSLDNLASLLAIFGVASLRLIPAANLFSNTLTQLRFNRDAVSRLVDDLDEINDEGQDFNREINRTSSPIFNEILLKNVTFSYKNTEIVSIDKASIQVSAGEVVGIIGASGSGKTTLIDLMLGLLDPQSGNILYNNNHLRDLVDEWRSQVAYLPQKTFLIDDTLRSNITFGISDDDIDSDLLWRSIKKAQLSDFISLLPQGLDTKIGESGERLSGGQRQRIALARAFYFNRKVLIMDESTNALDSDIEEEIINEIKELKGKLTIIIISHRIKTMKFCDRFYKIESGRVSKSLKYDEIFPKS